MTKLSSIQADVLRHLTESEGLLIRKPGGFWTLPSTPMVSPNVPAWFVTMQTVRALEARGYIERVQEYAEDYRDTRKITEAGTAALAAYV